MKGMYKAIGMGRLGYDLIVDLATSHSASPDVQGDEKSRRLVRYFHGPETFGKQSTAAATSIDGIHFEVRGQTLHGFWTQVGHTPEKIMDSTVDLSWPW